MDAAAAAGDRDLFRRWEKKLLDWTIRPSIVETTRIDCTSFDSTEHQDIETSRYSVDRPSSTGQRERAGERPLLFISALTYCSYPLLIYPYCAISQPLLLRELGKQKGIDSKLGP
ncbi:hypothetical protein BU24DRAFT_416791 [Aaosphaeria arxii CBS 175.79]|uniref:Uncharacterized protein n=1 Tax=Aaosphaeria arxii CBS 175.79 TaxID=1450172 RepID=A0A6A5Y958_9PLEO|nr:uncharacterized protein BU24DRAFT_416791 [Aaosphaeria arxii CBS 175.79]KAF2021124.1 hypothetical protein BU24DRAFT_416791 [Aaosphaeria arxii CBS 175.79]